MKGHNSGPVSAGRLKSFVERVEKLAEERAAINSDIRDVFAEAKGVGYDVKTMRKVVALRKIDEADRVEQEALLDTYRHALGMATDAVRGGSSLRQAARTHGVSKSVLQRAVPRDKPSPATGEKPNEIKAVAVPEVSHDADGVIEDAAPQAHESDVPPLTEPLAEGSLVPAAGPEGGDRAGTHSEAAMADEMPDMPEFLRRVPA